MPSSVDVSTQPPPADQPGDDATGAAAPGPVRPIRWGILATGAIASSFATDLATLPDAEVAAVASRSLASANAFASAHRIPRAHGSWQEIAADPDIDVIYVATPHAAHYAAAMICLDAGKAVLCEKPFTLDYPTAEELVTTARAQGVFLMEAMWMRANPTIRRIAALVAAGAIGEVTHISADFGIQGPFPPHHRLRALELGGGALLDLGVYPITFAHLFLGPPQTVRSWAALTPEGSDMNTGVILGYDSGAVATVQCGFTGETSQRATITGTAGRIEVPHPFYCPDSFTLIRARTSGEGAGDTEQVTIPVRGNGLAYQAEEVMRCLRLGLVESPLIPHSATLAVMRTLDAVRGQIGVVYADPPSTAVIPTQTSRT